MKAVYKGPLSLWHGKTAIVRPAVLAQFDDRGQYTAHGWHPFDAKDFKVEKMAPLFVAIATAVSSANNCELTSHPATSKWRDRAEELTEAFMPSGSGFDSGTKLDLEASGEMKLTFTVSFHHMNEHGFYDGWTEHQVIVTPSLVYGFNIRVTGSNKRDIKEYIAEMFQNALSQEVPLYV